MAIRYEDKHRIFKLDTKSTTYMIGLTPEGYVGHVYYGERMESADAAYLLRTGEHPHTPSAVPREKSSFLDFFPTEYPTGGVGDYRESCLDIRGESGSRGCEILYDSYAITQGKPELKGLPASFGRPDEVDTLAIVCVDKVLNLKVILSYSVFEEEDVITRNVRLVNEGEEHLRVEKVLSACLDLDDEEFEMVSLAGGWARERGIQRRRLAYGKQMVSSAKGGSSHQEHPFLALVTPWTTQNQGRVYAMNFVYSGNFTAEAELNQHDAVRMTMGINSEDFCWNLRGGEEFQAPEAVFTFSGEGFGKMSRSFHDFYRKHMIRSPHLHKKRPVLINNWEATYFDFDTDKLLDIAREAKKAGIEMLVMDDGWFGKRDNDDSSLGDWTVNEDKIKGGLKNLVDKVLDIGLEFGIWFEPEMISPDSRLYREHPEWAIHIPGRQATQSRAQYVLDLSNPEVVDYAYECVAKILRSAPVSYVKWDMNRQLSDLGSSYLDRDSQQELFHRYVLGLYEMQERLVSEFPDILLENCSSGGGRFYPGMLYYSPQIWCSDNTDAVDRLAIQEGTALIYPLSAIGAHVSDCPNHMTGRITPFETRGHVALAGTFGYELDITKISQKDRERIPGQIKDYHRYNDLIREGDYYRIASYRENHKYDCFLVAAKDKSEALMTFVQVKCSPTFHGKKIRLLGLEEKALYRLEGTEQSYTGEMLMKGGFVIDFMQGDAVSRLYHFVRQSEG